MSTQWLPVSAAAKLLGVGREQVRRRAVKGNAERRWCDTQMIYLYRVDGVEPSQEKPKDPERRKGEEDRIACYLPERDYYMVSKSGRRRPQIIEGWLGRAILDIERKQLEEIREIKVDKPARMPRLKIKDRPSDFSAVVGVTDFHFGKLGDETAESNWNMDVARETLLSKVEEVINLTLRFGQPKEWVLPVGSDWFNQDTDSGTTTNGTHVDNDGTYAVMFRNGVQLFSDMCEALRVICPIRLVFMPGNHDRTSSLALMSVLRAMYKDSADVMIHDTPRERQYIQVGSTLLAFNHGDKVPMTAIGQIMSHEASELWGKTKHRIAFSGHLHHERVLETKSGVICVQMPSLAGHDRYHYRGGWTTSRRSLAVYLVDGENGLVGQLNAVAS